MAQIEFLLQGLEQTRHHFAAVQQVLSLPQITRCLIGVAFLNSDGANSLASKLSLIVPTVHFYIGINNGITTKQGIEILLREGICPYVVDTAAPDFIFHPKVFLSENQDSALLITGSANLTGGGLVSNIEASTIIHLDLHNDEDRRLVDSVFSCFYSLQISHPIHIVRIDCETDLAAMVQDGLLKDEEVSSNHSSVISKPSTTNANPRPRMALATSKLPSHSRIASAHPGSKSASPATPVVTAKGTLLWKSGPLKRRDLNIPTGSNTHQTGSMLLKRGDPSQNIDQRHFFRDTAFSSATWVPDIKYIYKERCQVKFRIIIRGVDWGIYTLTLSHDTRTNTKSYKQNNSMTQIHWTPDVKKLIGQEALLDKRLLIYGPALGLDVYTLDFDG